MFLKGVGVCGLWRGGGGGGAESENGSFVALKMLGGGYICIYP